MRPLALWEVGEEKKKRGEENLCLLLALAESEEAAFSVLHFYREQLMLLIKLVLWGGAFPAAAEAIPDKTAKLSGLDISLSGVLRGPGDISASAL